MKKRKKSVKKPAEKVSKLTPEQMAAVDEMIKEWGEEEWDEDNPDLDRLVGLVSDHAGHEMRIALFHRLKKEGYFVADYGPFSRESVDYTDYAHQMACDMDKGEVRRGIALCYTGNGMNMTLNRHESVRSALCWNLETARLAREHNDANVCTLPAHFIGQVDAEAIMMTFLNTDFSEERRHARRVKKIHADYKNIDWLIERVITDIDNKDIEKGAVDEKSNK